MFDYHNHTAFSHDSEAPMTAVIEAAVRRGLKSIAITDHYDPDYPNLLKDTTIDLDAYFLELTNAAEAYKDVIHIVKGIELGLQDQVTALLQRAVESYHFDFVLGSFHVADGMELYGETFYAGYPAEAVYQKFYENCYRVILKYDQFDVMGHVNIIDRYATAIPAFHTYRELVEGIFKRLIEMGKGIELNTSSIRYGMGEHYTPTIEMLKLFRAMGGEIVTIGSDSHRAAEVGSDIDFAVELLKTLGYKYRTLYQDRKPVFVSL
ncbi:histidinol-phosphatase HisJ family protein [Fusibacter paucivorans]|uniref:Histidinol-phosphatase n=1 Tax=Fusibacter paucivorans TaxID=76009 RepID=A0ABS5PL65_9FIRM|nr:histidinol-phosphatase HisJ family protein [Fusibacter paucivorans]MBS7525923.1 histidinol-phosphatase HisJ family protein [Fusibacter paucivorans]